MVNQTKCTDKRLVRCIHEYTCINQTPRHAQLHNLTRSCWPAIESDNRHKHKESGALHCLPSNTVTSINPDKPYSEITDDMHWTLGIWHQSGLGLDLAWICSVFPWMVWCIHKTTSQERHTCEDKKYHFSVFQFCYNWHIAKVIYEAFSDLPPLWLRPG